MAIKVSFPSDTDSVIVRGLYQWDYGQTLELELPDIGTEIAEVHFACEGMNEAIVRPCSFVNGLGSVTIPDHCLEQTTPIKAWIFRTDGTQGHTVKMVSLPVNARTRPAKTQDVPQEFVSEYALLIESVNSLINELENGNVTVKNAKNAETAGQANSAKTASQAGTANYSVTAGTANTAKVANSLKVPSDYAFPGEAGINNNSLYSFKVQSFDGETLLTTVNIIMDVACDTNGNAISSPSFDLTFKNADGVSMVNSCRLEVAWSDYQLTCYPVVKLNSGDPMTGLKHYIYCKNLSKSTT